MAVDEKNKVVKSTGNKSNQKTNFLREVKSEFKRISWPVKKDIKKAFLAVISFCLLYIVFIGAVDLLFKNLFKLIFKLK
ncbi:preprotein translocase subunit SecE [Clostridium sp. MSJ-4]|uniref:Protein translocase subunit SecE n=1 Tax=Clostridium simiarum TaxID=2841506 RepID=A0ABS6F2B1_9CLOT|nr:preprotein translocase subunit SecE [Clostridium simiarum]MBU5591728.1 preprotein translocase subunit SecE [Clostridium simiarum]